MQTPTILKSHPLTHRPPVSALTDSDSDIDVLTEIETDTKTDTDTNAEPETKPEIRIRSRNRDDGIDTTGLGHKQRTVPCR